MMITVPRAEFLRTCDDAIHRAKVQVEDRIASEQRNFILSHKERIVPVVFFQWGTRKIVFSRRMEEYREAELRLKSECLSSWIWRNGRKYHFINDCDAYRSFLRSNPFDSSYSTYNKIRQPHGGEVATRYKQYLNTTAGKKQKTVTINVFEYDFLQGKITEDEYQRIILIG